VRLVKYTHASVRLENNGRAILFDPGVFADEPWAFAGVAALFVTHEHADHFSPERIRAALAADPGVEVFAAPAVARHLADLGDRVHAVRDGQDASIAGFEVRGVGIRHARTHPDVDPVDNVGFLVDRAVLVTGDALTPAADVDTLVVPGQAPWMTAPDLVGYLRTVAPRRALIVHDGLLNERGLGLVDALLAAEAQRTGREMRRLHVGEVVDLDR
jgi:L-ascorbate metabolism protein UlaG (beta-lactamase superfamily)